MKSRLIRFLAACIVGVLATLPTAAQDVKDKGQINVASHEIEMKAGNLYSITVQGKDFIPRVTMTPGFLPFSPQDFTKPNRFATHYMPSKDEKNTLFVLPEVFNLKGKGPFDYEIEVKALALAEKPIVEVKDELVAADPQYKADFIMRPHHKSYTVKMTAKQFYIIDMRDPAADGKLDHFLYLLDPVGKIIRSDDDGGGFPNARIVFQAPADGEYRIIATGLGQALGKYTLTVRTTK